MAHGRTFGNGVQAMIKRVVSERGAILFIDFGTSYCKQRCPGVSTLFSFYSMS